MEVADQWRRQWAGTAEYGKVTEGGVTRRVARAMEVLHASGPGARVRVMRAAYHSSAGPGAPAESFMLHSSRRVISSGFNFLEGPSLPPRPLEISSTPLELTHDSNGESENYKVTEPDDLEISEPSKWRGSAKGSSIRMPSEESSSTDNTSIIDLDSRNSKNLHRKYSYDSESSDVQFRSRSRSRTSQLLETPTTLSTLKYKSLLNNSTEWNTRRKSYSFEDTSPLDETILHNNETLAMESSTDSGICKSTEIVNDHVDDNSHIKYFNKSEHKAYDKEESFKDWLTKNRLSAQYRGTKFKTYREHDIVIEDPKENNIALQSSGKVSITLPITIEADHDNNARKDQLSEDFDRRVKKVGFCKTEVHFAAESGKVNIIATDEKPPPSNDFRKRRSAFVPMQDMIDRPITLFGEKTDFLTSNGVQTTLNQSSSDFGEPDENAAATKSILKNKIPKPKPYLLGENMDFGISAEVSSNVTGKSVLTAVSLVNRQMEEEKLYKSKIKLTLSKESEKNVINNNIFRTINAGPAKNNSLKHEKHVITNIKIEKTKDNIAEEVKNKVNYTKDSPTQVKPKTRQLRDSDLTYFGIDNHRNDRDNDLKTHKDRIKPIETKISTDNILENIFHSVKLIQQVSNSVSNSVCNSEPESEESPEYQNLPLNLDYAPVPTPRLRSTYDNNSNEIAVVRAGLKPIIERNDDETGEDMKPYRRRTKVRRHEEVKPSRSLSEPPKKHVSLERSRRSKDQNLSSNKYHLIQETTKDFNHMSVDSKVLEEDIPIYANLNIDTDKLNSIIIDKSNRMSPSRQKAKQRSNAIKNKITRTTNESVSDINGIHKTKERRSDFGTDSSFRKKHTVNKDTISSSLKRELKSPHGERISKSHYSDDRPKTDYKEMVETKNAKSQNSKHKNLHTNTAEHNSRSLPKTVVKSTAEESGDANCDTTTIVHQDTRSHRKRNSSKDKISAIRESSKSSPKLDSGSTERYPAVQTKSGEKEKAFSSNHHHRSNKHREYVINYDDKNGTVSSICKIKPSLGTPRRKKTSKEMLKENHKDNQLKSKIVDKIPLRK